MIRRLWLRNWKAYDSLDLELRPGTTFLVADNGIGKSSVIQALSFGLFGRPELLGTTTPVEEAVRGGHTEALVGCQILLGDHDVTIERRVNRQLRGSSRQNSVLIQVDGAVSGPQAWYDLLRSQTGVDSAQLELLAFVPEGATITRGDAGMTVVSLLSEIFGVNRLRDVSAEFGRRARRLDKDTDDLRRSLRDVPRRADAERKPDLVREIQRAEDQRMAARGQLDVVERRDRFLGSWRDMARRSIDFQGGEVLDWRDLAVALRSRVLAAGLEDVPADFPSDLASVQAVAIRLSEKREQLMARRGHLTAVREAAANALSMLSSASPTCPVCYQPLSRDAATAAMSQHERQARRASSDLGLIESQYSELQNLTALLSQLLDAEDAIDGLRVGRDRQPVITAFSGPDRARLEQELSQLEAHLRELYADLAVIDRDEEERLRSSALSARLIEGYRAVERAHLAASTMAKLADAIYSERISPLAIEVQKRWPYLWAGSSLTMDEAGAMALELDGYLVPYNMLSGGQRTLAQIVVHVLALQMATRSPFLVLDEPLEHLDPRNRRALASLLVNVTSESSKLRQVLVTTYEESVTRRLSYWPKSGGSEVSADDRYSSQVLRIVPSELGDSS